MSLKIIMPIGFSFFIFSILSYLIEIKRGNCPAEKHLGHFALSLLFFPKIIQGPIERPMNFLPQIRERLDFHDEVVMDGLKRMIWGYFKKLVVADRLAIYINAVYGNYEHHSGISLLIATIMYSFQIYADFSGYTDIALGSAKTLGIDLSANFNRPYYATSIKDFWDRWHISFSNWLRDYLFFPMAVLLAGKLTNPKYLGITAEKWIFMFAALTTFAICGIWHGVGLHYLVWGLLFGIYLTIANWSSKSRKQLRKRLHIPQNASWYRLFSRLFIFALVTFAWIFFRSESHTMALSIIRKMITLGGPLFMDKITISYGLTGTAILLIIEARKEFFRPDDLPFRSNNWFLDQILYAVLVVMILLIGVLDGGHFIYFQF